jgi:hypothetical protein
MCVLLEVRKIYNYKLEYVNRRTHQFLKNIDYGSYSYI